MLRKQLEIGSSNSQGRYCFILFPKDPIEGSFFILRLLLKRGKLFYCSPPKPYFLFFQKLPLIGSIIKSKFIEYDRNISDFDGLWYQLNDSAIRLAKKFYNKNRIQLLTVLIYLNKKFSTDKFEAFIKKRISQQIFVLLGILHLAKNINKESRLIIKNDKVNQYVVEEFNQQYKSAIEVIFLNNFTNICLIFYYWSWLIKEFAKRGFTFRKARPCFKLSVEACAGFHRKINRDDVLIDGKYFTKDDILFCQLTNKNSIKNRAFNLAKEKGFCGVPVYSLPFNIKDNFFEVLNLYFFFPIILYFKVLFTEQTYLFYNFPYFFKRIFPMEVLLSQYRIGCKVSLDDADDVPETIILNKYGTKSVIYNWSDLTTYRDHGYAFIAHNVYFVWGDIHYDYHCDNYFVDRKVNIGCIFKNEYNKAVKNKEYTIARMAGLRKNKRIVTFFDTSFSDGCLFTQSSILKYLETISEFCMKNKEVNVLLKAKNEEPYTEMLTDNNHLRFKTIWDQLSNYDNFSYLSPLKWGIEEIIAISDVCINMGLNSPSTIALICGKDALYYNFKGNDRHPFARNYKNTIVLEDKDLLFQQINNILKGNFKCKNVISEQEIRQYDAFSDDQALDRLRSNLYELTL